MRRAVAVAEAALGSAPGWLLGIPVAGGGRRGGERGRRKGGNDGDGDDDNCDGDNGDGNGVGRSTSASAAPPPAAAAALLAACGKHAFLFECAETRRAVGIAVVEPLASGTRLRVVVCGEAAAAAEKSAITTTTTTTATTTTAGAAGAALGVRGVWTAPSHRRRGIATALLDAARANAVAYTVVGRRDLVVFSQPTDAGGGAALAAAYAGGGGGGEGRGGKEEGVKYLAYYV